MSDIAIEVSNLSKRYRIGLKEELHDTFVGSMTSWLKSPLSNYKRVHSLASFSGDGESDDVIWALKDVSFEIKRGEVVGIIGENGAGKSTLLKILSRIIEPTNGQAIVNGNVSSLLEVGTGFHPELTGRENVFLNGAILGMTRKEIDQKFEEIIDFSGIERFIDTPVKRYSSGMYVRLAFSVAAHLEPEIFLVDEVLAVGDHKFRDKCLGKMKSISRSGRTILFVSHNLGAIQQLCDRAVVIQNGQIKFEGKTDSAIDKYLGSGKNEQGEKLWLTQSETSWTKNLMPGEEVVYLKAVRVLNKLGEVCTEFSVRDEVFLQMEFDLKRDFDYLECSYFLYNKRGELVIYTVDDSRIHGQWRRLKGSYCLMCLIPKDLLNQGQIFVTSAIAGDKVVYTMERNVVSFSVKDNSDPEGARGLLRDTKWPAASVRPKLDWKAEYQSF